MRDQLADQRAESRMTLPAAIRRGEIARFSLCNIHVLPSQNNMPVLPKPIKIYNSYRMSSDSSAHSTPLNSPLPPAS